MPEQEVSKDEIREFLDTYLGHEAYTDVQVTILVSVNGGGIASLSYPNHKITKPMVHTHHSALFPKNAIHRVIE